jgi:hypothetical protein
MKANAKTMAPGATGSIWKDTSNFFHKGTNKRWQGVFTEQQVQNYRALAQRELDDELVVWLERGSNSTD